MFECDTFELIEQIKMLRFGQRNRDRHSLQKTENLKFSGIKEKHWLEFIAYYVNRVNTEQ